MAGPRYSILPAEAVFDERLTGHSLRVLAALGSHTDNNGWCIIKQKTLAARIGSSADSVRHAVVKLEQAGYVRVRQRFGENGARLASLYQVCMDREPSLDLIEDGIEPAEIGGTDETPIVLGSPGGTVPPDTGGPYQGVRGHRTRESGLNKNDLSLERPSSIEDRPTTDLLGPVPKGKAPRGGCSLPSDFQPDLAFAVREGMTQAEAEREAQRFADHWIGVPGKDGRKADWPATWRNWVRRAVDQRHKGRPAPVGRVKPKTVADQALESLMERKARDVPAISH